MLGHCSGEMYLVNGAGRKALSSLIYLQLHSVKFAKKLKSTVRVVRHLLLTLTSIPVSVQLAAH